MTSNARTTRLRALATTAVSVALTGSLVACGSSTSTAPGSTGSTGGTNNAASAAGVARAKAAIAPFLKQSEPLTIHQPLSKKPPTGKTVYWLQGSLEDTSIITPGITKAAQTLGWSIKTLVYDPSQPQQVNSSVEQAVAANADYIAIAGSPMEQYAAGLAQAKAKNIPIFDSFDSESPQDAANGIYSQVSQNDYVRYAKLITDYVIADSNGAGSMLLVNVPAYPALTAYGDNMKKEIAANCPGCGFAELDISQQDLLAGNLADQVVGYLRTHTNVKYVVFSLGALTNGVAPALASAGLSGIKLVGSNPDEANLQALKDGTETAWLGLPKALVGWYLIDAMARYSVGDSRQPDAAYMPTQIITKDTVPDPLTKIGFDGPANYDATFEKLWNVN